MERNNLESYHLLISQVVNPQRKLEQIKKVNKKQMQSIKVFQLWEMLSQPWLKELNLFVIKKIFLLGLCVIHLEEMQKH